jgi:ADP-ribose pyrophosphatase YjhB (NUDIX family)
MLNQRTYQETLPKKRMGAGVLFLDEQGRVLLVNPTYKPQWEIPGGIVELNESPRQAAEREVAEELGIVKALERLLCVAYTKNTHTHLEGLMFIFYGGVLLEQEIATIQLPMQELSEFRFVKPAEVSLLLTPTLSKRVLSSLEVIDGEQTLYLEG